MKSFFVGCTSVPVCHSLVRVSVTFDEVLCTGAGRDDGRPKCTNLAEVSDRPLARRTQLGPNQSVRSVGYFLNAPIT